MNPILRHYLRIDARSLGLFRILMGLVLLGDLLRRWTWVADFYSNEGVLPNHNHLFNLRSGPGIWSGLHAVSTDGEAKFAFVVIAGLYVLFIIGWRTRVFHALSFVALLSLTARNLLLEGSGNHLALALLLVTLPLPLGSRLSIDAIKKAMAAATEKTPAEIRAYQPLAPADVEARRMPGWSPPSLGALAVLVQLVLLQLAIYLQHNGAAWKDGSALGRALDIAILATPRGFALRDAGFLGALTHGVHYGPALAAVLLLVPVARGATRAVAALLILLQGLVWGLLFNFGLFGWSLVAASALALSSEAWDAIDAKYRPARARTVIFDADCGICGWLAKLLVRLDTAGHMTLQGNDELEHVLIRKAPRGPTEELALPRGIDAESADKTIMAVRSDGTYVTRAAAIAEIMRGLPRFRLPGLILGLPGIVHLMNVLYDLVAKNRHRISAQLGMGVCGIPIAPAPVEPSEAVEAGEGYRGARPQAQRGAEGDPSPFQRTMRKLSGSMRELFALGVLATVLVQTTRANEVGFKVPEVRPLVAIAHWTRTQADWRLLAPEPPTTSGTLVTDAVLRNDATVDLFTGEKPDFSLDRPFRLGELWSAYFRRIHQDENEPYVAAFRTYISRGGPMSELDDPNLRPLGADAWWVEGPAGGGEPERQRILRHGRGGPSADDFTPGASPAAEGTPGSPGNRRLRNR